MFSQLNSLRDFKEIGSHSTDDCSVPSINVQVRAKNLKKLSVVTLSPNLLHGYIIGLLRVLKPTFPILL